MVGYIVFAVLVHFVDCLVRVSHVW